MVRISDYSGQYPGVNHSGSGGGSYHPDPNYANFNPYAQEFMLSEQDRQYDQQVTVTIYHTIAYNIPQYPTLYVHVVEVEPGTKRIVVLFGHVHK